ncbi:MAG: cytochrome c-type biogenesis protein CcmH [Rhodospirillales bacterium]|nr:cytochrome c-type biogenesis protein CcmH [Rhodospirillales bacterium]
MIGRAALVLFLALSSAALAVNPDEILADPAQEARARAVGRDLRCLVCQNQSIDDSDAGLARDLRIIVRERIKAGDSDSQIKDYLVGRYGDFVLLNPPFKPATWLLWLGPLVLAAIAAMVALAFYRRAGRRAPERPLSEAEKKALEALIKDQG